MLTTGRRWLVVVCGLTWLLTACGHEALGGGQNNQAYNAPQSTGNVLRQTSNSPANPTITTSVTATQKVWPKVTIATYASLPVGVEGVSLAADGHRIYAVGGYTGAYSVTSVTQIWPSVLRQALLPVRLHDAATGIIGNDLYVFGGGQNDSYHSIYRISGTHVERSGDLSAALSDAVSVPWTQNGHSGVLVVGGYDGQNFHRNVDFFVMNGGRLTSKSVCTLPVGLRYPAVAVTNGTLVIVGGKLPNGQDSSAVYRWSPGLSVQKVGALPYGIEKAALFAAGQNVVMAGGLRSSGQASKDVIAIHIANGQTRTIAQLRNALYDMGYVQFGTSGFLAGGTDGIHVSAAIEQIVMH